MSCTTTNILLNPISCRATPCTTTTSSNKTPSLRFDGQNRRQLLFFMTATAGVTALEARAMAEDIGLFGLRKKIKKAEEEAEEIVKEGIEEAEKGIEAIENAEKEIETEVSFGLGSGGGLVQAGAVVGAEVVGVLVATSVVNGILGSES